MNMLRDEIGRDVANVAIGPHPPAPILRERVARVAPLSEACVRVEFLKMRSGEQVHANCNGTFQRCGRSRALFGCYHML